MRRVKQIYCLPLVAFFLCLIPQGLQAVEPVILSQMAQPVATPPKKVEEPPKNKFEEETLIYLMGEEEGEIDHGGYGGPVFRVSQLMGQPAYLFGVRGGWIINHFFTIGGSFLNMENNVKVDDDPRYEEDRLSSNPIYKGKPELDISYGGLLLELVIGSNRLVHGGLSTIIGTGSISKDYELIATTDSNKCEDLDSYDASFFIIDPTLEVELNLFSFLRLNIGAGYRFVNFAGKLSGVRHRDINGFSGSILFKFGSF
jgi:hypothetical protein